MARGFGWDETLLETGLLFRPYSSDTIYIAVTPPEADN